jgi:hypothetical protein
MAGRSKRSADTKVRAVTHAATAEIVAELPDGFNAKDARACVRTYLEGNPDLNGATSNAIGRGVTSALNALVNEGALAVDDKGIYRHADTASVSSINPQTPVGL